MDKRRVVVTGVGVVSPLGIGVDAFRAGLLSGANGVRPISLFDASALPARVAGEVPGFDDTLLPGDARYHRVMNRAMKFAAVAAAEALASSELDPDAIADSACIAAVGRHDMTVPEFGQGFARAMATNGDGSFTFDRTAYLTRGVRAMHPLWLLTFIPNLAVSHVGAATGVRGEANTLTTEGAAGIQAVNEAAASIREGLYDVALCGGCDARITPLGVVRSIASGLLAESEDPRESRPFDVGARGFVVGEGAAFFVLEEAERARTRGGRVLAEVAGWGEGGDAYHPWRAHPEGRGLATSMRAALARAAVGPEAIDLVVGCAASLPDLDNAEACAVAATFDGHTPALTAPASSLGRAHAAAGALGVAAALMALDAQAVPVTINTAVPIAASPRGLVTGGEPRSLPIRRALVNGYAIGGECASVVLAEAGS